MVVEGILDMAENILVRCCWVSCVYIVFEIVVRKCNRETLLYIYVCALVGRYNMAYRASLLMFVRLATSELGFFLPLKALKNQLPRLGKPFWSFFIILNGLKIVWKIVSKIV